MNTALVHFGGKQNSRKMTFETKQNGSVFGLARQCLKHLDDQIILMMMMVILVITANIH